MLTLIKTFYAMLLGKEGEPARKAALVILAVLLGGILIIGIAVNRYRFPSELENKIDDRAPVITESETNTNAQKQILTNSNTEVHQKEKASQNAVKRQEKAIQADSKEYKDTDAGKRFCERFPEDSTCR